MLGLGLQLILLDQVKDPDVENVSVVSRGSELGRVIWPPWHPAACHLPA
jgi:hypothetical protein